MYSKKVIEMVMSLAMVPQLTGEVETVHPGRSKVGGGQKPQVSRKASWGEFSGWPRIALGM